MNVTIHSSSFRSVRKYLFEIVINYNIGRRATVGGASPENRVTTEKKKQKALKTQCFQGFLVVRVRGLEPPLPCEN